MGAEKEASSIESYVTTLCCLKSKLELVLPIAEACEYPWTNLDIKTTIKFGAKVKAIVAKVNRVESINKERLRPNRPLCKLPPIAPIRAPNNIILAMKKRKENIIIS